MSFNQLTDQELLNIYNKMFHTTLGEDHLKYVRDNNYINAWRKFVIDSCNNFIDNHPPNKVFQPPPIINEHLPANLQQVKLKQLNEIDKLKLENQELK